MLKDDKLRKADLLTGSLIILFGGWVAWEALQMPMTDSYGGVQNVWYVSPALFPLFTGGILMALGAMLLGIAVKSLGREKLRLLGGQIRERVRGGWRLSDPMARFFAIVVFFFFFVYMNIPRVDFVIASLLFLVVFILPFYLDDPILLRKLFGFYFIGSLLFLVYFALGLSRIADAAWPYFTDILNLLFLLAFLVYSRAALGDGAEPRRRWRIGVTVAFIVPFLLCPAFKYFLLVPLPHEGMLVAAMDVIYYAIF